MSDKKTDADITRMDVLLSQRLKRAAKTLAEDQGCTSVSEYVRNLIRKDAEARGFDVPETYPKQPEVSP